MLLRLIPIAVVAPLTTAVACSCTTNGPWSYEETLASAQLELEVTILKPLVAGDATDGHGFREVGVDFAPGSKWAVIPVLPGRQKHVPWKRWGMPDFDASLNRTCGKWFRPL